MSEWTICPHCGLKHTVRADSRCPRCGQATGEPAPAQPVQQRKRPPIVWIAAAGLVLVALAVVYTHGGAREKMQSLAAAPPVPAPAPAILHLRERALAWKPEFMDPDPSIHSRAFGMLMETGSKEALASLVAFEDGTVSLYLGTGGGVIGAGEHLKVRQAGMRFLVAAEEFRPRFEPARETPLPRVGQVKFYLLTAQGTFTAEAAEEELGGGGHPLSPLFQAGQEVLTEIRRAAENS